MYGIDIVMMIKNMSLSIHMELLLIYMMYDIDIVLLIMNMSLSIHIEFFFYMQITPYKAPKATVV